MISHNYCGQWLFLQLQLKSFVANHNLCGEMMYMIMKSFLIIDRIGSTYLPNVINTIE